MTKQNKIYNLAVLASGNGSNLQAIIDGTKTNLIPYSQVMIVISDKKSAFALNRAQNNNIENVFIDPKLFNNEFEYNNKILEIVKSRDIDLILLAGYLKIICEPLLDFYHNKILNIHPSLLPKFGGAKMYGINVHKKVIKNKEKYTGCTVHIVTKDIDKGPIIAQKQIKVNDNDTPESLKHRILTYEHDLYPKAIKEYLHTLYEE